ncbi:MAG TPA: spondin domain-containing protein [Thiobacillus sp.]
MATTSLGRIVAPLACCAGLVLATPAMALQIRVTVENLSPVNGTFLTPFWFGFHDGSFSPVNIGSVAPTYIERIAEDGNFAPLQMAFSASAPTPLTQGVLFGPSIPPIGPGERSSLVFNIDGNLATSRYFSYASMVIPSNDAFVANDDPLGHMVFDGSGRFLATSFILLGSEVLDAGTEVNDEIPLNTAFFGQASANTGVDENGVIQPHPGFQPAGNGGILGSSQFANADFKAPGYQLARVTISAVPEPTIMMLMGVGLLAMTWLRAGRSAAI